MPIIFLKRTDAWPLAVSSRRAALYPVRPRGPFLFEVASPLCRRGSNGSLCLRRSEPANARPPSCGGVVFGRVATTGMPRPSSMASNPRDPTQRPRMLRSTSRVAAAEHATTGLRGLLATATGHNRYARGGIRTPYAIRRTPTTSCMFSRACTTDATPANPTDVACLGGRKS